MKKTLTLLLALCLLLSLAACGVKPIEAPATEAPKTEAPKTEAPKTEPATTEAPATEAPATEAPATEAPATETPATEAPIAEGVRGVVSEDAYENEMLDLRVALPEGWVFYTDEQIAQVNNITAEVMADSDVAELIGKNGQFIDMMMASAATNNINLMIQASQPMLSSYSDEQIFTLSEQNFKAQFQASGLSVSKYEPVTMQVGGEERTVLHLVLSINDAEMDEYQIWFRNDSDYMGVLTLAIADGSDPQPILDGITKLN